MMWILALLQLTSLSPTYAADAGDSTAGSDSAARAEADPHTIDLERAVAIAARSAVDVEAARIQVERAATLLRSSRQAFLPDLGLAVSGTASVARTFSEGLSQSVTSPGVGGTARVMSTIPVYEGGALRAGVQSARQALRSREATLERTRQDLQYVLAGGLLYVAEARGSVALAEAVLTAEQTLRARVAAYVDAGSRTRADLLQEDAAIAKAEQDLVSARSEVARAELALMQVLRLDPAEAWTFVPPNGVPDSTSTSAEAVRADVQASEAAVQAASADVRAAQATALPSAGVALGASTSWLSTESASVSSQLRDQAQTWATVEIDVPIFDRGLARNAVANAHTSERAARLDLAVRQEAAATDQAAARISVEAARAAVAAAARHRDAAVAASAVIEQRYEAGAASLSELSAAHAESAAAERDVLTASIAVRRAAFEWAWAIGE